LIGLMDTMFFFKTLSLKIFYQILILNFFLTYFLSVYFKPTSTAFLAMPKVFISP